MRTVIAPLALLNWLMSTIICISATDKQDVLDALKFIKRRQASNENNVKTQLDDEAKAEIFRNNFMSSQNQQEGADRSVRQQPIFPASISAGGSPQNPALFRTTFQPGSQSGNNRPSIAIAPSPVRPEIITLPLQALTRETGPVVVAAPPPPKSAESLPPATARPPAPPAPQAPRATAATRQPARPSPPPRRVVITAPPQPQQPPAAAKTPQNVVIFTRPPPPKQTQQPASLLTSTFEPRTRPPITKQSENASSSEKTNSSPVVNYRPNFVSPSGKTLLNPHPDNFCDGRQYPDELLMEKNLQRVEYFVANLSCSRQFFECAVGQTYQMNCTSYEQVFDISTVICNFKSSVKACPEFDNISHCTIKEQCGQEQFACCASPQQCIPYSKRCDGTQDCSDGEDENNCPSCEADEFPCVKSGKCISLLQHCNGVNDECMDQTNLDETYCQICGPEKFYCSRSDVPSSQPPICLDLSTRCNGQKECPKGEDELNCKTKGPKILLCEDQKQSVNKDQWCDGTEDCIDGSDEQYCVW